MKLLYGDTGVIQIAYALGVDIGGTKIASLIINEHGEQLFRAEVKSNSVDREKMFQQVIKSIEEVLEKSSIPLSEIQGIGVGVPGKVDQVNGIAVYQNNLPWRNFPIVERLRDALSVENIVIDNDVYMATYAEWKRFGKEGETFVYVTVSTGISCSIIHKGEFFRGAGFAGELGLVPVISESSPNNIERLEKSASGPAMQKQAREKLKQPEMTPQELFQKYSEGDLHAQSIIDGVIKSLAHGIYSAICVVDPHTIVLGGGVINHNPFLLELVKDSLKQYLIAEQEHILENIQLSYYQENSGAVGAGLRGFSK